MLAPNLHGYLARGPMPQQALQTERITLVPLADEHLEWEVELDSDFEVMRYLSGRASTREEVVASHARRATARKARSAGRSAGALFLPSEHGELMPQHEQLDVLGDLAAPASEKQPAAQPRRRDRRRKAASADAPRAHHRQRRDLDPGFETPHG
jgi:hypothetical protein